MPTNGMKKTILGICLMTFALAGCQKELVEPEAQTQLLGPVEFYAVLEEFTPGAKTSLNENRCVIWSEGDQLAIFQGSTLADKYQVKEGQAGGTNTNFSIVKNLGGNKDDDFSGGTEIPFDTNIAIYPFEDDLICNPIYEGEEITSYQIKNFTIPAVQTYAENSFAEEAFAMTAITNGLADHNLKFKNVCGALKLQLKGTATVKKIELKGNADEQIAGDAVVTVYADGTVPSIEMNPNATTVITLDCEGGVELNESSATTFMFAVPPTDFDTGFTATITATDGKVGELKTIKPNPVRRAAIKAMPEITPVMEIPPVNLSENGTANCYIVSAPGYYKFSPTQGNSQQLIKSIASAQVLWETFGTATRPNVGDLIQSVSFEDNAIFFYTAETYKEGNAVIAAKDASGTILWSWHIWFTDQPEEQVYPNNAGIMMDRNLGATSATPGEVEAYGLHYQWGRKDPFLGSNVLTYRDEYGSSIDDTQKAASTLTWPQAVYAEYTTVTIDYTIKKPTTRVIGDSSTYDDWMSDNPDQTRWKPTKTIYDPCPAGWRVPTGGSSGRDGFWANAGFENANYDSANFGFSFNLGSGLYAWYPLPGYYAYNYFNNPGYGGTYWSCTADGFDSYAMSISNYNESPTIKSYYEYDNHHAYSVRCFKEGSNTGAVVVPPATPKDGAHVVPSIVTP